MASQPDAGAVADGQPGDRLAGPSRWRSRCSGTEIDAIQWTGLNFNDVKVFASGSLGLWNTASEVLPLWEAATGAVRRLEPGDWVIRETDGSGYFRYSGARFTNAYERIDPAESRDDRAAEAPEPSVSYWWGVAYGGDDPNECAGILTYDDEAEAEEQVQWIDTGYVARQKVARWPWERADGKEIPAEPEAERLPAVGVAMIRAERARQVAVEGYDEEHDAGHRDGELALAAAAYALAATGGPSAFAAAEDEWPFDPAGFKAGPKPVDSLVKAGALIAAEIDRIIAEEAGRA